MNTADQIKNERAQNMRDIYDNKMPKRVPIEVSLPLTLVADYAKIDRKAAYWDPSLLKGAAEELCERIPADTCLYGGSVYTPVSSQTLNAINKVMSDTGYMQHPNTVCMQDNEYDELIADPYAFIIDKCIPRLYKNLDVEEGKGRYTIALAQESYMKGIAWGKEAAMMSELNEKFGYSDDFWPGFGRAPMDWIADQLRSFSGICSDVRRHRAKLIASLEAIYPMLYKIGVCTDPDKVSRYNPVFYQLHMATYLREKDFAEVWLPTWKRLLTDYASLGMRCGAFLEHDWTRLLDYLYDLPTGCHFTFEFTDAKLIKKKLGQKHILGGGFPLGHLTTCSKSQVIDKTKEWLDIMAPGGQYIFGFDKSPVSLSDINLENLIAVCETVRDYGVYGNPGEPTGQIFNKADYQHSEIKPFESKYYQSWEDYLSKYPNTPDNAKALVMDAEDHIFTSLIYMTC